MNTTQRKQAKTQKATAIQRTAQTINRRRRRRVVRAMAGAVIGGFIAGPIGAAVGAVAAAAQKRGPMPRKSVSAVERTPRPKQSKTAKPDEAPAGKRRPGSRRKKTVTNIYPPIP